MEDVTIYMCVSEWNNFKNRNSIYCLNYEHKSDKMVKLDKNVNNIYFRKVGEKYEEGYYC